MSILSFPRINFKGIFRTNPCTTNNDDVMPAGVERADDAFGADLAGMTDDQIFAFLRQQVMMSNGDGWPCQPYIRSGWNLYGDHSTAFDSTVITSVVTGPNASQRVSQASADALVGQPLLLLGSVNSDPLRRGAAILCDVDPTGLVTTQLWIGGLQIGSGGPSGVDPSQIVAQFNADTRGFQDWLNFASTLGTTNGSPYGLYGGEQNFCGIGCVMQFGIPASAIPNVTFNSPGLQSLVGAARGAAGLVVRFRCFEVQPGLRDEALYAAFQQGNAVDNPALGYLVGTIGVWWNGEPQSEVPGRKLTPPYQPLAPGGRPALNWQWDGKGTSTVPGCPVPWQGAPALVGNVVAQVQGATSVVSLDLVNAFPKGGFRDPNGPSAAGAGGFGAPKQKADLGPFELAVLPAGGGAAVTVAPLDYGLSDYSSYEDYGGIVDVPFASTLASTIASGTLVIRAATGNTVNTGDVVALQEVPIRLITDDRGVYLMPGQQNVPFRLKVSERGGPTSSPTVVNLLEYMNIITTQTGTSCPDGVRPNQTVGPQSGILNKPTQVTIPAGEGFTDWFIVNVSTTSVGDATILSYQLDTTVFGNSVPAWSTATYSTVRVYDDEDFSALYAAGPIQWNDVYQDVLRFYYLVYPAMSRFIPLNDAGSILGKGALITQRLNTPDQAAFYSTYNMPLTRTMSPAKVKLVLDFIAQGQAAATKSPTS